MRWRVKDHWLGFLPDQTHSSAYFLSRSVNYLPGSQLEWYFFSLFLFLGNTMQTQKLLVYVSMHNYFNQVSQYYADHPDHCHDVLFLKPAVWGLTTYSCMAYLARPGVDGRPVATKRMAKLQLYQSRQRCTYYSFLDSRGTPK